jgi:hypothetical protein
MQLQILKMTLTGALKGKTKVLNGRQFTKGVCTLQLSPTEVGGVIRYYERSYAVKVSGLDTPVVEEPEELEEIEEDNEAIRVDDSDVQTEQQEIDQEDDADQPNERQAVIISAVNCIEKKDWIEQETNPHPKVADVSGLMDDPTVTKKVICEVIEKWLS